MAEQEFGKDISPFPYDADELNRMITKTLTEVEEVDENEISAWQTIITSILQSDDKNITNWLNRLRKAYWLLAILGMDPQVIELKGDHLKNYCIYLDSHIVLRAMVLAGGDSEMCKNIVEISQSLNIEMRLSHSMFNEINLSFYNANKAYYAAGKDITRALSFFR